MQKDQANIILAILLGSFFVLLFLVALFMLFRIFLTRKNKLLMEKQSMAIEFEQTLLKSKLEIQEETFAYISGELHDNVGQVLSLLSINLNRLKMPGQKTKLAEMDELLAKALTDLRNLSHSLDADHIRKTGWRPPVIKLLQQLEQTGNYQVTYDIADNLPSFGDERPFILFRMVQEIINNITRHSNASAIYVEAKEQMGVVTLQIRDNGKGFDPSKINSGAGLANLARRAQLIKADLATESSEGNGTIVTIAIKI